MYLIATKARPTLVGSSINTVSNSYMQMIQVYVDAVTVFSSKERCKYLHGMFIQRTVELQVWIIEEHSLKVREMQEPQEYAQLRFQRRGDRELHRLRKGTIDTLRRI